MTAYNDRDPVDRMDLNVGLGSATVFGDKFNGFTLFVLLDFNKSDVDVRILELDVFVGVAQGQAKVVLKCQ